MTTGEKIKARREELGLTQVDVAKRLDVSKSFINKVENDRCKIPLKRVVDIAVALSCSPAELIGEYKEEDGLLIELDVVAKQLSPDRIGALIQYAKFLAREKDE